MNLRICSLHFEKQHFKISVTGGHMFCNRAVPTVFVETAQTIIDMERLEHHATLIVQAVYL